jgi:uncharacterized membrane protein SpoIIM required for sporulation
MLESILNFKEVNKSPYLTFIWALIITSVAVLISTQISYQVQAAGSVINLTGIFSVIFTLIASVYFVTVVIKKEEKMEEEAIEKHYKQSLWVRHEKDIMFLLFYFLGVTFAFAIWSFMLPSDIFNIQIAKINEIRGAVLGDVIVKGSFDSFIGVLVNNLRVMGFAFLFALLFCSGALFIIVWNASVLGVYVGALSKSIFEIPIVFLYFLPHGIPEVVGYLCAGLAGGILSAAILREHKIHILKLITFDSVKILLLGIALIFLAAGIEVYL